MVGDVKHSIILKAGLKFQLETMILFLRERFFNWEKYIVMGL